MKLNQGDIFWVSLAAPRGSAPGFRRPYVIIQNDLLNQSRIRTVIVCSLTTNLARARVPGNVLLDQGEAGLPHQSVVNVTQMWTVDKSDLDEIIGTLSSARIRLVLDGIRLITEPRRAP